MCEKEKNQVLCKPKKKSVKTLEKYKNCHFGKKQYRNQKKKIRVFYFTFFRIIVRQQR